LGLKLLGHESHPSEFLEYLQGIPHLRLTPDGAKAENWKVFSFRLKLAFGVVNINDVYLDDVIDNSDTGQKPFANLPDEHEWLAARPDCDNSHFEAAQTAWCNWVYANSLALCGLREVLPEQLQREACQQTQAADLWAYISNRFSAESLPAAASISGRSSLFLTLQIQGGSPVNFQILTKWPDKRLT
jgi:hypothetical protein